MRRFLIYLSGARRDVLAKCPTEQTKFEGLGGAVFTTAVLAAISMLYALWTALHTPLPLAAALAACWGLAIMSLDRWMSVTLPVEGRLRFRLALPRVLLGVLMGFVLSTPLVLQIFEPEISAHIAEIKLSRADTFIQQSQRGDLGQRVIALAQETQRLEEVIASNGDMATDPASDPAIASLMAERKTEESRLVEAYQAWRCVLYGGSGCSSGRSGQGPLATARKAAYDASKRRIDQLTTQIDERRRRLTDNNQASRKSRLAEAQERLPLVRNEYNSLRRQQSDLQTSFNAENQSAGGLLLRLQALDEVSGKDSALSFARILLFFLFVLIECLPVAVRLMQRPGLYERLLAIAERSEFRSGRDAYIGMRGAGPEVSRETTIREIRDIWATWETREVTSPASGSSTPYGYGSAGIVEPTMMVEDGALRSLGDSRHEGLDDGLDLFHDDDL